MKHITLADIVLGAWLVGSPFVIGYAASRPAAIMEDIIPGAFLVISSCWILTTRVGRLQVNWLQAVCGLWLIIGSFVLLFSRLSSGALNDLIVGIVVLAVNIAATSAILREPQRTV